MGSKSVVRMFIIGVTVTFATMFPTIAAPQTGPGYDIQMSRMIPMRDGVELEAWIFKPTNLKGKTPTVLALTQYDLDGGRQQDFPTFVRRGYVFMEVFVRGRRRSGGFK